MTDDNNPYHQTDSLPNADPDQLVVQAVACIGDGRIVEAETLCLAALRASPRFAPALAFLGVARCQQGKLDEAVDLLRQAADIAPDDPMIRNNLGNVLITAQRFDEALVECQRAARNGGHMPEVHNNIGAILQRLNRLPEAVRSLQEALRQNPRFASAHYNMGSVLKQQRKLEQAVAHFRESIAIAPNSPRTYNNLGNTLREMCRYPEAIKSFRTAIDMDPRLLEPYINLALVYQEQGEFPRALELYAQALAMRPEHVDTHVNLSMCHLLMGNFRDGWREYEWRWENPDMRGAKRTFAQPRWDGSPGNGRTLLVYAEQGHGDSFQFIRYAALAAARGLRVVVESQPQVKKILSGVDGVADVVVEGGTLPAFDLHCSMIGLAAIFTPDLCSIPVAIPYLPVDAARAEHWKQVLAARPGFRIGVVWQGNPQHKNDHHRSFKLNRFAPIAAWSDVQLISLQKQHGMDQVADFPGPDKLLNLGPQLDPGTDQFIDTAAVISQLDLVITADTAVAHLAGALGRPVWVLLPYASDWRWLTARADSPWYPSMRLFRQPVPGDWDSVFADVYKTLQQRLTVS